MTDLVQSSYKMVKLSKNVFRHRSEEYFRKIFKMRKSSSFIDCIEKRSSSLLFSAHVDMEKNHPLVRFFNVKNVQVDDFASMFIWAENNKLCECFDSYH